MKFTITAHRVTKNLYPEIYSKIPHAEDLEFFLGNLDIFEIFLKKQQLTEFEKFSKKHDGPMCLKPFLCNIFL